MNKEGNRICYVTKDDGKKRTEPWKLKLQLIARIDRSSFVNETEYKAYMKKEFQKIDAE